jgi:Fe-S-cluster containining protein
MKYIDLDDLDKLPGVHLKTNDTFSFHCHPGVGCFNRCCRNLNLFLYPYDVIRLKNNLDLSSDQFLDQYVDVVLRESSAFPEVLLRMSDNDEKTCPFMIESGCSVYPDRPDTCRTFPVEQGLIYDGQNKKSRLIQFFRPPDFCLGQHERKIWTSQAWAQDQNAVFQGTGSKCGFPQPDDSAMGRFKTVVSSQSLGQGRLGKPTSQDGVYGHL